MRSSASPSSAPPAAVARRSSRIEEALREVLPPAGERNLVEEAMAWSLLAGGKRLRPVLALAAAAAYGAEEEPLVPAVCGLECLHTYSLVHDDLPSMDDDDLRRGRPTCHKRFGEAMAILAGDALQTLGFELLLAHPDGEAWAVRKVQAVRRVAAAVGRAGMVLGQALDLSETGGSVPDAEAVESIHRTKTAALFQACVEAGSILGGGSPAQVEACGRFGLELGLAFQIVDDLLDVEGTAEDLGKETGGDEAAGKATAVAAWGLEAARDRAGRHRRKAEGALADLERSGAEVDELAEILGYVLDRRS